MKKVITILLLLVLSLSSMAQESIVLTNNLKSQDSIVSLNDCCWEIAPKFPGGDTSLSQFFKQNLIYPDSSKRMKIEGVVVVSFKVDTTGKINNLEIIKGVSEDINREVERVFSIMPNWISGMCGNGTKRIMQLSMPISFKL